MPVVSALGDVMSSSDMRRPNLVWPWLLTRPMQLLSAAAQLALGAQAGPPGPLSLVPSPSGVAPSGVTPLSTVAPLLLELLQPTAAMPASAPTMATAPNRICQSHQSSE
jgi:hypothetical protein